MKTVNKQNRTIRKEDLDIGMEYTITGMKCVTNKFGKKPAITIHFIGEMVDLFAPKRFDCKAADLIKKLKKLEKGIILKAIERKNIDKINYLDIELNTKY